MARTFRFLLLSLFPSWAGAARSAMLAQSDIARETGVPLWLEKLVASSKIPKVHRIKGRLQLSSMDRTGKDFDHSLWDACLKAYVSKPIHTVGSVPNTSTVDYLSLSKDKRFQQYIDELATVNLTELSAPARLALWMNAYNALCIGLIIKHQGSTSKALTSINDISTRKEEVWDMFAGVVGGERVSLNDIEHRKLRAAFDEPLLHACIVCASASCPNLRDEAFVATRLEEQMADQMSAWLMNQKKGMQYDTASGQLTLSRIFLWFRADFGGNDGVVKTISKYFPMPPMQLPLRTKTKIKYFPYDWSLNEAK